MVKEICLDSDIMISFLKKDDKAVAILQSFEADYYTTVINIFEIWYGKKKVEPIPELLEWINILDLEKESAILAAEILIKLRKIGQIIEYRDAFVAGICIANNIPLLTFNKKHFSRLKKFGLKLV